MSLYNHFDQKLLLELVEKAASSKRKRSHLNLHNSYDEATQKTLIALTKGTYIPPHYHRYDHQKELFIVLSGNVKVIFFDDRGSVVDILKLSAGEMVEVLPFSIHTVVCMSSAAVVLEVKNGPFIAGDCKETLSWTIPEGVGKSEGYLKWLESADLGSEVPDYFKDL